MRPAPTTRTDSGHARPGRGHQSGLWDRQSLRRGKLSFERAVEAVFNKRDRQVRNINTYL